MVLPKAITQSILGQILNPGTFSKSREQELYGTKVCRINCITDREISCHEKQPVLLITIVCNSWLGPIDFKSSWLTGLCPSLNSVPNLLAAADFVKKIIYVVAANYSHYGKYKNCWWNMTINCYFVQMLILDNIPTNTKTLLGFNNFKLTSIEVGPIWEFI